MGITAIQKMHIKNQIQSFTYLGGKFSILPWLLPLIDVPCKHFVDVMGGSAVVLLNRKPAPIETYNDINHQVVNFFTVLRSQPEKLIEQLQLTPHSRFEYENAWFSEEDNSIEQARKFFIRTQQSIHASGAQDKVKGWCCSLTESRVGISEKTNKWINSIDNLYLVTQRLKHVQIECRDFRFVLKQYDSPDTLFYLDSPYDMTFRSSSKYLFDFKRQDFYDMQYWCKKAKAKVAVSGYATPFMKELFNDFNFHIGPKRKNGVSQKPAFECLWTNY